jgi:predicted DCC family thiol-disulfide oxidoreductase YuxK
MPALVRLLRFMTEVFAQAGLAWSRFWFQKTPTAPLELTRIGIGVAMFTNYSLAMPYLLDFWGDDGWMLPRAALDLSDPWQQSIFFYFSEPWQWIVFHVLFLLSCLAFTLGWHTALVKWIVLVGQISYAHRNPILTYGVDKILASLLIILCLAPIGRALSLDRLRTVRAAKCADLRAAAPPFRSRWAGACTRLMQIQMAVLFFYSGLEKIRGDEWWNGDAVWFVFVAEDMYNNFLLNLFASHYWLVNAATYGTLLIELSYPFLIWQRRTRPYLLAAAIFLHVQFGTWMGMPYFSLVMIMGHMSFVRPEWLRRLGLAWKQAMGDMEMIYDGRCGFCVRSMAWFLSFDGLRQIRVRDFRTDPSPLVSDAQMEKALYLVLPDGRTFPGFEAYRYVVLRVPGLWWQVPFFYVPVVSRLVGHPIYNWIAANRNRLSYLRLGCPPALQQAKNVA